MAQDFSSELTAADRFTIRLAVDETSDWPPDVQGRYSFYRRRGYDKADSLAYALAWAKNTIEQADRRRPLDRQPVDW